MVRYAYNQQVVPPAPFVHVTVRSPQEGADGIVVPAQIDTAADLTVIPGQFVEILRLAPLGSVSAVGLVGHSMTLPTLLSRAPGQGSWSGHGHVIASDDEPYVLLGRDVLNRFTIMLDGPNRTVAVR